MRPLTAKYYIEPGWFDVDKEKIFYRTWQCVCHVSEVAAAGQYVTHKLVDEDVFPGLIQIMEDETLFNPVFWYEMDEMKQAVRTEGEVWEIRQIQNVGLAYYAIPSKLLAWAVDKVTDTHATKRSKRSGM